MAILTLDEIRDYLSFKTTGAGSDALLLQLAEAAEKQISQICKRPFEASTGTRYYREDSLVVLPVGTQYRPFGAYGRGYSWDNAVGYAGGYGSRGYGSAPVYGRYVLQLDENLLSVDTLTNGDSTGTAVSSTGYRLYPRNRPPYRQIELLSGEQWLFGTDGEISVAGTWGYSTAAPADIRMAMLRLTAYYYRQRDAGVFDVTATPELGIITVPQGIPADVEKILKDGGYVQEIRFA